MNVGRWSLFLMLIIVLAGLPVTAAESGNSRLESLVSDWGGQLKAVGRTTFPEDGSLQEAYEQDPWLDGSLELRVKNRTFFSSRWSLNTHYQAGYSAGDTRESRFYNQKLLTGLPLAGRSLLTRDTIEDDRRLLDLTGVIRDDDDEIFYHRLDRFCLEYRPDWGRLAVGRQAVSWGNGLLFNPMDLFNPFSPYDIDRDYKTGDDMVNLEVNLAHHRNLQLLYVPRRDPQTRDVDADCASLAANFQGYLGAVEAHLMLAEHYDDAVVGCGASGYLAEAVWRFDATYTFADGRMEEDFWAVVANIDYSWIWLDKNVYGFLEFYYSGLGTGNYRHKYTDPDIAERMGRGEIFTAGRCYISPHLQVELHPLLNTFLTVTVNAEDPSGCIQPRMVWDFKPDMQLTFGGNAYFGSSDTEFGGVDILQKPFLTVTDEPGDSLYLWLTMFF